jgi:glycine cleavage system H lipoate-binding protein
MLAAAFFVTVVIALGGYHFLIARPRSVRQPRTTQWAGGRPAPLEELVGPVPGGVFLQNGFTWSRLMPEGSVEFGVHPMLFGLLGPGPTISLCEPGEQVDAGAPLLELGTGERAIHLRAPISGQVTAVNRFPRSTPGWDDVLTGKDSWMFRIVPDDLARDIPSWMIGAPAAEWTRDRYERIREHLQLAVADGDTGIALADGGEVPVGALAELDSSALADFEARFLNN